VGAPAPLPIVEALAVIAKTSDRHGTQRPGDFMTPTS
jgi:hypothetical protein